MTEYGPDVWCDFADRETFTRVWGGKAFCSLCGATDHKVVAPAGTL